MDVIFDIDGTLLDITHRVHLIRPAEGTRKDWQSFRARAVDDVPIQPIVNVARALHSAGHRIAYCTGRMLKEYALTLASLKAAGLPMASPGIKAIYMRMDDDLRADYLVKLELLEHMKADGFYPELVFDDRNSVVSMWRSMNIRTCQVAPGDF